MSLLPSNRESDALERELQVVLSFKVLGIELGSPEKAAGPLLCSTTSLAEMQRLLLQREINGLFIKHKMIHN